MPRRRVAGKDSLGQELVLVGREIDDGDVVVWRNVHAGTASIDCYDHAAAVWEWIGPVVLQIAIGGVAHGDFLEILSACGAHPS